MDRRAVREVARTVPSAPESSDFPRVVRDAAGAGAALAVVLSWLREEWLATATIPDVVGTTSRQTEYLTRLAALVLPHLGWGTSPRKLQEALAPAAELFVPVPARQAFAQLVRHDPTSLLALLYARTVAAPNRRALGTFFTPRAEARSMVEHYAARYPKPTTVVDIGAGVGVFSEAAVQQWPGAEIHAVDINPITLALQAVALSAAHQGLVRLHLDDYSSWLPLFEPKGPTVYLGNPPYTRWQLIPAERRLALVRAADGLVGARANLSTLFLATTIAKLRPEDGLCLIVPASWMGARYATELRAHVRGLMDRRITLRLADSWRFDNAIVDAVVVEVGPVSGDRAPLVVTDWLGDVMAADARTGADALRPFVRSRPAPSSEEDLSMSSRVRLRDLARVTRGTATGANAFFILSEDQVVSAGIDPQWLVPIVRRLRPGSSETEPQVETAAMLVLDGYERGRDAHVDAWIRAAEDQGLHEGHLCGKRRPWFDLSAEVKCPDVVISALGKGCFHVYENGHGMGITNNLFGMTWHGDVPARTRSDVVDWLRSEPGQQALANSSSVEADGLRRLSPRTVGELRVESTFEGQDR